MLPKWLCWKLDSHYIQRISPEYFLSWFSASKNKSPGQASTAIFEERFSELMTSCAGFDLYFFRLLPSALLQSDFLCFIYLKKALIWGVSCLYWICWYWIVCLCYFSLWHTVCISSESDDWLPLFKISRALICGLESYNPDLFFRFFNIIFFTVWSFHNRHLLFKCYWQIPPYCRFGISWYDTGLTPPW